MLVKRCTGGWQPDNTPCKCKMDHTQTRRRLSELQGDDPMILILSRGPYCPKDNQQHLELAAFYPKIAVAYTRIVTISTANILETREFHDSVGAQWTFLSDSVGCFSDNNRNCRIRYGPTYSV